MKQFKIINRGRPKKELNRLIEALNILKQADSIQDILKYHNKTIKIILNHSDMNKKTKHGTCTPMADIIIFSKPYFSVCLYCDIIAHELCHTLQHSLLYRQIDTGIKQHNAKLVEFESNSFSKSVIDEAYDKGLLQSEDYNIVSRINNYKISIFMENNTRMNARINYNSIVRFPTDIKEDKLLYFRLMIKSLFGSIINEDSKFKTLGIRHGNKHMMLYNGYISNYKNRFADIKVLSFVYNHFILPQMLKCDTNVVIKYNGDDTKHCFVDIPKLDKYKYLYL